jgi:hypothetical protein
MWSMQISNMKLMVASLGSAVLESMHQHCRHQEGNAPDMSNHSKTHSQTHDHRVIVEVTMMAITPYHNNKPDE